MTPRRIGSGVTVTAGLIAILILMLWLGRVVGWDPLWRAFGVTPLHPPFFDMHVINDYAACVAKGIDPYLPRACNVDNFNIPPPWLWFGFLGVDGSDSTWISGLLIFSAAMVAVLLFSGRSWRDGVFALGAIISPSVMMGVERGNLDLLIFALVGAAALTYDEKKIGRACAALVFLCSGIVLKLIPIFCVSLVARFSKATLRFAICLGASSLIYLVWAMDYVFLIRRNVPTTFILSYGYKAIFLGLDHVRSEARLEPIGLADTWLPAVITAIVLLSAMGVALKRFSEGCEHEFVDKSVAGTAFLFGAGIYCGTFLLGTNFDYRLMFLLLCVPQLLDWQLNGSTAGAPMRPKTGLYCMVLGVLWLNGSSDGHSLFLLLPQLLDWSLFACLTAILTGTLLTTAISSLPPSPGIPFAEA